MKSLHKMIVLCTAIGAVMYFAYLSYSSRYIHTGGEPDQEMIEPSMEGPRGAVPATAPQSWILPKDYPQIALDGGITGETKFRVTVTPFGEVDECTITKKSGYPELDKRVCSAVATRAKFYPALDDSDRPTEGSYSSAVIWTLD